MSIASRKRSDVTKAVGRFLASPKGRTFFQDNGYETGMPMLMVGPHEPVSVAVEWSRGRTDRVLVATLVGDKPTILMIEPENAESKSTWDELKDPKLSQDSEMELFAEYLVMRAKRERNNRFTLKFHAHAKNAAPRSRVHAMA